jgi:hypothetical protein
VTSNGVEIGTFRAGSTSPLFGVLGSAVLRKGSVEDGDVVEVAGARATVAPWCVYDPDKKRPRA